MERVGKRGEPRPCFAPFLEGLERGYHTVTRWGRAAGACIACDLVQAASQHLRLRLLPHHLCVSLPRKTAHTSSLIPSLCSQGSPHERLQAGAV